MFSEFYAKICCVGLGWLELSVDWGVWCYWCFEVCGVTGVLRFVVLIVFWIWCRVWDNVDKYGRAREATGDNIARRMCFACWIIKATDTHLQYAIFISFPPQKLLHERALILRYTYIACLYIRSIVLYSFYIRLCIWTGITCLMIWLSMSQRVLKTFSFQNRIRHCTLCACECKTRFKVYRNVNDNGPWRNTDRKY
jgi:hypothetical protein